MTRPFVLLAGVFATTLALAPATPASVKAPVGQPAAASHIDIPTDSGSVRVTLHAANIVHMSAIVDGKPPARSMVLDPALEPAASIAGEAATTLTLSSPQVHVRYDRAAHSLSIANAQDQVLLHIADLTTLVHGKLDLGHAAGDPMYGVSGYDAFEKDVSAGMLRQGKLEAKAGEQGWAGAPLAWSTAGYAVLADIDGGHFTLAPERIDIAGPAATPLDVYVIVGAPKAIFAAVADLSGHTPLFPKWAMGFTNSQWGIDQKELLQIVDTYRARHIPIDNFTLDFDWKAWGEDHYGEFRWNPAKFPDGPGGKLAKQLQAQGIQLTGIMKPRLHVDTVEGRYATEHDFWVPGEKVSEDYFSHKPVKNIDFDIPAARTWFADLAMKYGFDQGIVGWWNDEADTTGSDTEFMNMQRALYEAQRAQSKLRVWSVNRNFWLGSQRYAYGLWSGDIDTGFASMAGQRARMLSAINVGAMQWGMDGGGFKGHPSNENYARWIQFGAFTPIFRVHGVFDERRQPWVYGPVAEQAATAAIRLRYALIPYIYSYEYARHVDGIGLVRPLLFDWPHDPNVANDVDSWLFGDYLLVSPVVQQGQTEKRIYLPAGTWLDWFSGKSYPGGQTITLAVDATHWSDIPLFVREGAIIPTQPVQDYVGQKPVTEISIDAFPTDQRTSFDYYDDDGSTYAYEHGAYFRQPLSLQQHDDTVTFETARPSGSFQPALRSYLLKIHGHAAQGVSLDGKALNPRADMAALQRGEGEGWAVGHDRFGPVTWVRIPAGKASTVTLRIAR
ncbi:MAG: TIM-barrel domain-containing protein [Rhodanobacter lindaniclasticus]